MRKSTWRSVLSYFGQFRVGETVPRAAFLYTLREYNRATLDTYRCYLQRAGYLGDPPRKPGLYKVERWIPLRARVKDVLAQAYGHKTPNRPGRACRCGKAREAEF